MWADAGIVAAAYLVGCFPHLQLLARLRRIELRGDFHQDLWHGAGKIIGVAGVVGEFVKGVAPVLVARALGFDIAIIAVAGLATVCGQMWPVFTGFDGEKGNSIAIAMTIALIPVPALVALIPVIIAVIIRTATRLVARSKSASAVAIIGGPYSRALPLGMLVCFLILPFSAWGFGETPVVVWCCIALFVLIMLRRLTAGLSRDIKSDSSFLRIATRRLLYDRATVDWRG